MWCSMKTRYAFLLDFVFVKKKKTNKILIVLWTWVGRVVALHFDMRKGGDNVS